MRSTLRGFTLLETVLASVVGSLVLAACFSMFMSMSKLEKSVNRASRQMEELALTQQVLRKSFLTMVLVGEQALQTAMSDVAVDGIVPESARAGLPRPRMLIEFDSALSINSMLMSAQIDGVRIADPSGFGMGPQRIEIVLPEKPVPESMRLFPAGWSSRPKDDLIAAFDPSGIERPEQESGLRGVFELRPDGARERVMEGYGITPATGLEPRPLTPAARRMPEAWTLWWRPVYGAEYEARQFGQPFDIDSMPELLVEAVPLIRGVRMMRVMVFAGEEDPDNPDAPLIVDRWSEYESTTTAQLPGYIEFELETTSGSYANWVFELAWSLADETITQQAPGSGEDPQGDGDTPGQTPGGTNPQPQPDSTGQFGEIT